MFDGVVVGFCVEVGGLVGVEMEVLFVVVGEGVLVLVCLIYSWMKLFMFIWV